jgi:hypothetical protein
MFVLGAMLQEMRNSPIFHHSSCEPWEAAPFLSGTSWMDEEHGKNPETMYIAEDRV